MNFETEYSEQRKKVISRIADILNEQETEKLEKLANALESGENPHVPLMRIVSDNRRWERVDETLPEEDGHYEIKVNDEILNDQDAELSPCWYDTEQGWMFDWYSKTRYKVTHWRKIKTTE